MSLKLDRSDWMFLFTYVLVLFVLAFLVDFIFHIVDGSYLIGPGIIIGGILLRNRILIKKKR